jgi:hypothetical protein
VTKEEEKVQGEKSVFLRLALGESITPREGSSMSLPDSSMSESEKISFWKAKIERFYAPKHPVNSENSPRLLVNSPSKFKPSRVGVL